MVIRVNISELERKAKYAESLYIQLKIKADEINSIYYTLDPKVKSRNGIGQSIINLQKKIEEAQQKMYNISKFLYSAADNYRNAEEQIVSNSKRFEDSHRLYDEQYSDYNYIKNLNIFEGTDIEGINSVNNVEMDSRLIDYLKKSGNQLILGNYTEDVTLLGTLMQVGTGLLGVDLPMDLRDILYDFTNWKWSWEHAGKAGMDLLALFPIIGGLKYADEASSLAKAAFKNTDEASALMKGALKNTDEASTLIKGSLKSSDEIRDIAKGVDETAEAAAKGGSKAEPFINGMIPEEAARYKDYWYNSYAQDYADVVNTNKPWKWRNISGGDSLTAADKVAIKSKAVEQGLIPEIQMKPGTRYADFQGAGVVQRTEPLPESLWKARDKEQFDYLDNLIGGRPGGTTWNHSEITAQMELVPFGIHNVTNHIGGRSPGHWAYRPGGR